MRVALFFLLSIASASQLRAQQAARLVGYVRDTTARRPLIGAIVTLTTPTGQRSTRTDESGEFVFQRVSVGSHSLAVRRLGYEPEERTVEITSEPQPIEIAMSRVTRLDPVRVRGARQAIYGAIARARDLAPITHAIVQV